MQELEKPCINFQSRQSEAQSFKEKVYPVHTEKCQMFKQTSEKEGAPEIMKICIGRGTKEFQKIAVKCGPQKAMYCVTTSWYYEMQLKLWRRHYCLVTIWQNRIRSN